MAVVVPYQGSHVPFLKQSGMGAEMGQEGLEQFTQIKIINIAK